MRHEYVEDGSSGPPTYQFGETVPLTRKQIEALSALIGSLPEFVPGPTLLYNSDQHGPDMVLAEWQRGYGRWIVRIKTDGTLVNGPFARHEEVREMLIEAYKPEPCTRTGYVHHSYFDKEWCRPHSIWPEHTSFPDPDQYTRVTITEILP